MAGSSGPFAIVIHAAAPCATFARSTANPADYRTPDVVMDITEVEAVELGRDRVRLAGARGRPRPDRLKVLCVDESGVWVYAKRLERGTFSWPCSTTEERRVEMRAEELALLLGGLDAKELKARAWKRDTRSSSSAKCAIRA